MYIRLAEADRLKVLQSPEGAEKTLVDTNDAARMVVLYERVLPYAVLFGYEKEWTKSLSQYYESQHQNPTWYSGTSAFNPLVFGTVVSGLTTAATNNYTSSGSGFSGGGGYSGGGGGGGGFGGR